MSVPIYPLLIEPRLVPLLWGGDALVRRYGKHADPDAAIGESWECWDNNRVLNGVHAGKTIAALREELGADLMGLLDSSRAFPVLTKFIDARQSLSVQVHPDDAYARRVEKQPNGKTECWYILEAQPDAALVLGFTRDTSREEYLARVKDGTLGELLRRVPARAGDVFYLPAGTLHAIGAGILLFEVQQTSDLTYRIFDWNRLGSDGKPRELHIEKAADVLDYHAASDDMLRPSASISIEDGVKRAVLVDDARFRLERIDCDERALTLSCEGLPLVITAEALGLELEAGGMKVGLPPHATVLAPAALGSLKVTGSGGKGAFLAVTPRGGR